MTNVKLPRRRFLRLVASGTALTAASGPLRAQTYPARPIMMIVPFLAGGPTDAVARIVAEGMRGTLDQPVETERKHGRGSVNDTACHRHLFSELDGHQVAGRSVPWRGSCDPGYDRWNH